MPQILARRFILLMALSISLIACTPTPTTPTTPEIASLQISPSAALLSSKDETASFTVKAYDAKGNELELTGKTLEWRNSDSAVVSLTEVTEGLGATISSLVDLGSANFSVGIKGTEVLSSPANVTIAKPKDTVTLISDSAVVFPPVDVPANASPETVSFEHIDMSGAEAIVGGFSLDELGALYANQDGNLRYPVVFVNQTVKKDDFLLASGGAAIAGKVISVNTKGIYSLVQLELVGLTDLFDKLRLSYNTEELLSSGVATTQSLVSHSPSSQATLQTLADTCKVTGSFSAANISLPAPQISFTPSISAFVDLEQEQYSFVAGLTAKVVVEPGFKIQPGITGTLTCPLGKETEIDVPIPAGPLAAAISGKIKLQPIFEATANFTAGPRLEGKGSIGGSLKIKVGFDTRAKDLNQSSASFEPILTSSLKTDTSAFEDKSLTFTAGAFETAAIGVQIGGKALGVTETLTEWLMFEKLQSFVDEIKEALFITLLNGKVGPLGKVVWDSPKRVLNNEASSSTIGIDGVGQVNLGGEGLKKLLTFLGGGFAVDLTLAKVTFNLGALHRVFEKNTITASSSCFNGTVASGTSICVKEGDSLSLKVNVKYVDAIMIGPDTPLDSGELYLGKDQKLADMTVAGSSMDITLPVSSEMCEGGTLNFLAYNIMVWELKTAGYGGKLILECQRGEGVPPQPITDEVTTPKNTAVTFNVLANDQNSTGGTLSITSISTPTHGTAVLNSDQTITYTPNTDYVGADGLTYTVANNTGGTATGAVLITVTDVKEFVCDDYRGTYALTPMNIEIEDPAGHLPFTGNPLLDALAFIFSFTSTEITGSAPFINVSSGGIRESTPGYCLVSTSGTGTAAGFPNITATLSGEFNGTTGEFMGTYAIGTQGGLPTGMPIRFNFTGTLSQP